MRIVWIWILQSVCEGRRQDAGVSIYFKFHCEPPELWNEKNVTTTECGALILVKSLLQHKSSFKDTPTLLYLPIQFYLINKLNKYGKVFK